MFGGKLTSYVVQKTTTAAGGLSPVRVHKFVLKNFDVVRLQRAEGAGGVLNFKLLGSSSKSKH